MKSEMDKERNDEEMLKRRRQGQSTFRDRIDFTTGRLFDILEGFLTALNTKYRGVLEWSLHNRFLTLTIGFTSLLVVFAMPNAAGPGFLKLSPLRVVIALIALTLAIISMGIDRKSKSTALGFGVVMAFIALSVYLPFGFGFFPTTDQGIMSISIRTAPGTSLAATDKVVKQIERHRH
jgi:multidrug efflux pump subunit AcrB